MIEAIRTGKRAKAALAVASLVGLGGSAAHAASISVNFNNGATDLTNNFNVEANGVASTNFSWGATAGVMDQAGPSAGGGVVPLGVDVTAVYNKGSFDLTTGSTVNLSVMYLRGSNTGGNKAQIGLLGGPSQSFNGGTNDVGFNFISARVIGNGTDLINAQGGAGAAGVAAGAATSTIGTNTAGFAFTAGHWYELNVSITETNTAAGTFSVGSNIVDFGTAGTTAGATVSTYGGGTFTDSNLIGDTALWAGFRDSGDGTTGPASTYLAQSYDNFTASGPATAAPEPASVALLALGGLAGLSRRRRRV